MIVRPTAEQVLLLAPDRAAAVAAVGASVPGSWSLAGCDETAVWGQFIAGAAEPYDVAVDLSADQQEPAYRCSCPSRKVPCKHALGLLLLHANGLVISAQRLPFAAQWLRRRLAVDPSPDQQVVGAKTGSEIAVEAAETAIGHARATSSSLGGSNAQRDKRQFDRSQRMRAGLVELDRWLADRVRQGLAAPDFADRVTWDRLAQRLVDAQCGSLANRVKRIATKIGQHPRWHEDLLGELALLHVLAVAAQRTSALEPHMADGIHAATGLNVAKEEVLASVPSTTTWLVVGESRAREDRITVQRTWLCSNQTPTTWAMVLAFGAFGNEVSTEHVVGSSFDADIHWYPGGLRLRAMVGRLHGPINHGPPPPTTTISAAVAQGGWAIAQEPWLERHPMCVAAAPRSRGGAQWVLADETGSLRLDPAFTQIAELVCICGGIARPVMGEQSADGFLPLAVWAEDEVTQL